MSVKKDEDKYSSLCSTCLKRCTSFCGRCDQISYCSRQCQEDNWDKHKNFCYIATEEDKILQAQKRKLLRKFDTLIVRAIVGLYMVKRSIVNNDKFMKLVLINSSGLKFISSSETMSLKTVDGKITALMVLADENWNILENSAGARFTTSYILFKEDFGPTLRISGSESRTRIRTLENEMLTVFRK